MVEKLDLKKHLKHLYQPPSKQPEIVNVLAMAFLMLDGAGNPNTSPVYQQAVEALYGVSYALKFMAKKVLGRDYVVMPLEGLWWGTRQGQHTFTEADKEKFQWRMMIYQPDFITGQMVADAKADVQRKKGFENLSQMRFETFHEGLAVQILHIGPYDGEGPTVEKLHQFAIERGFQLRGKHHEIYLGDPRRTNPGKLRTILRHPVAQES